MTANAAAKPTCINNDCPVKTGNITYGGGALITAPNVYLVRFSTSATRLAPASGFLPQDFATSGPDLTGAINDVVANPAISWWQQEYSVPNYELTAGSYVKTVTVYDPALATENEVSTNALTNEMYAIVGTGGLSDISPNAIYVVVLRSTQELGNADCEMWADAEASGQNDVAVNVPFLTLSNYSSAPFSPTNHHSCDFSQKLSPFASETSWLSDTLFNLVLDHGQTGYDAGWVNGNTGTELTTVCHSGTSPTGTSRYDGATYTVARLWSIQAHACLVTPLIPKLVASFANPTSITASLTVQGHAEPAQSVVASSAGTVVATGITNSAGRVTLLLAALPTGTNVVVSLNEGSEFAKRVVSLNSPTTSVTTTTLPSSQATQLPHSTRTRWRPYPARQQLTSPHWDPLLRVRLL
jgi:hypothetical protein